MFLCISVDEVVGDFAKLPATLVQDGADMGMDGIQHLDARVPILVAGEVIADAAVWEEAGGALDSNGEGVGREAMVELG